jgi:beta-glucanase (GH16 family)
MPTQPSNAAPAAPLAAAAAQPGRGAASAAAPGATFDDEFTTLDLSKWHPAYDWSPDGYADGAMSSWLVNPGYGPTSAPDANPYSVTGDGLSVKVMDRPADVPADAVGGRPYLSGQLQTKGSFAQQYGYFEARAKLPQGAGVSGAFWLLPADGSWPPELDVVESDGAGALAMAAHTLQTGDHTADEHWGDNVPGAATEFHTYGVDWEPDRITWYVDGKQAASEPTPADFHRPMYILLDALAEAPGGQGGPPSGSLNAAMQVRYVRAYPSLAAARAARSGQPAAAPLVAGQPATGVPAAPVTSGAPDPVSGAPAPSPLASLISSAASAGAFSPAPGTPGDVEGDAFVQWAAADAAKRGLDLGDPGRQAQITRAALYQKGLMDFLATAPGGGRRGGGGRPAVSVPGQPLGGRAASRRRARRHGRGRQRRARAGGQPAAVPG